MEKSFHVRVFHRQGELHFCLINLAVITLKSDFTGCGMADWYQVFASSFQLLYRVSFAVLMEVRLRVISHGGD